MHFSTNLSKPSLVCSMYGDYIRKFQDLEKLTVSDVFALQLVQVQQVTGDCTGCYRHISNDFIICSRIFSFYDLKNHLHLTSRYVMLSPLWNVLVMRDNLPDLFDAQPDLLFQLVTMLNPSVLQENGVSVYNVMQEPGNFVVTFPKSFHGGFNFGLNCAEAVNFAPADWFPHGGFGAEWYRLYHKAQVLSHEELLCVVSQSACDAKALPYLKEEMHRIYGREKKCREELWRCGIVRSSRMSPRKQPMYVGTEEDPTCVICQQYLYLSAITCTCRPSAFVCLEHWQHLCECKLSKLRLLYRQTLAELYDLVHVGTEISEAASTAETQCCINSRQDFHYEVIDMTRKVKVANQAEHLMSSCECAS